ncbi:hypothetical protein TNCV_3765181 [Trichonephila clavipes]|nr:hypothetical protein TNCV_3765181 [Trichonephila clavipes]
MRTTPALAPSRNYHTTSTRGLRYGRFNVLQPLLHGGSSVAPRLEPAIDRSYDSGVHYRLFSVWTLVPVRLDQQLSDHSTVDEIASGAADCRFTYTMANCPQRPLEKPGEKRKEEKREREKEGKKARKRQGLVVLGSGEENPRVLFGDADQESETRMSKNALRTGRRQAVE